MMAYRPLSHYERAIVRYVLMEEQGLTESNVNTMFAAYTAFAERDNIAEFELFAQSEKYSSQNSRKKTRPYLLINNTQ